MFLFFRSVFNYCFFCKYYQLIRAIGENKKQKKKPSEKIYKYKFSVLENYFDGTREKKIIIFVENSQEKLLIVFFFQLNEEEKSINICKRKLRHTTRV